jgi:hypothetical protein
MGMLFGGSLADERYHEQQTRGNDMTHEELIAKLREIEKLCRTFPKNILGSTVIEIIERK